MRQMVLSHNLNCSHCSNAFENPKLFAESHHKRFASRLRILPVPSRSSGPSLDAVRREEWMKPGEPFKYPVCPVCPVCLRHSASLLDLATVLEMSSDIRSSFRSSLWCFVSIFFIFSVCSHDIVCRTMLYRTYGMIPLELSSSCIMIALH